MEAIVAILTPIVYWDKSSVNVTIKCVVGQYATLLIYACLSYAIFVTLMQSEVLGVKLKSSKA